MRSCWRLWNSRRRLQPNIELRIVYACLCIAHAIYVIEQMISQEHNAKLLTAVEPKEEAATEYWTTYCVRWFMYSTCKLRRRTNRVAGAQCEAADGCRAEGGGCDRILNFLCTLVYYSTRNLRRWTNGIFLVAGAYCEAAEDCGAEGGGCDRIVNFLFTLVYV